MERAAYRALINGIRMGAAGRGRQLSLMILLTTMQGVLPASALWISKTIIDRVTTATAVGISDAVWIEIVAALSGLLLVGILSATLASSLDAQFTRCLGNA